MNSPPSVSRSASGLPIGFVTSLWSRIFIRSKSCANVEANAPLSTTVGGYVSIRFPKTEAYPSNSPLALVSNATLNPSVSRIVVSFPLLVLRLDLPRGHDADSKVNVFRHLGGLLLRETSHPPMRHL